MESARNASIAGAGLRQPPASHSRPSVLYRPPSTACPEQAAEQPCRRVHRPLRFLLILGWLLLCSTAIQAEVTEAQVKDVAKELACLCGDCPSRPLDECRCGHAGTQRNRIATELDGGKSKDQIIAGFATEFGDRVFVTPPKKGFNLMAWFMPAFGILIGGYTVRTIMKNWSRTHANRHTASTSATVSEADRAKLESALGERDV